MQFSASGNITTRDGRSLSFQLDVSLQRSFSVSSQETLNFGAAARDPLMISLGSDAGTLSIDTGIWPEMRSASAGELPL